MSQRLGGQDCRPPISYQPGYRDTRKPCQGRDLDAAGVRIPCEHNGFIGVPLSALPREGRALNGSSVKSERLWTATELDAGGKRFRAERKTWKAPRLAAEGKPFEPALGEVGSFVGFERSGHVYRGQVWALAPARTRGASVWVVTEDQHAEAVRVADLLP